MGFIRAESPGTDVLVAENELGRISAALLDALLEAQELARRGEYVPPLRKALVRCGEMVARVENAFASHAQVAEDARGITRYMTERLAVLEALAER